MWSIWPKRELDPLDYEQNMQLKGREVNCVHLPLSLSYLLKAHQRFKVAQALLASLRTVADQRGSKIRVGGRLKRRGGGLLTKTDQWEQNPNIL